VHNRTEGKQPQRDVKGNRCIHTFLESDPCGRVAFNRRTSGWLCREHYSMFQASIPEKPRKPSEVWRGYKPVQQTDAEIIADVIRVDTESIAAGRVTRIQRGVVDPVYLKILQPGVC
jgi:hypothetical protein